MQKIIDGYLYDTDLAREVADNSEWLGPMKSPTGGRCKVTETLYREVALKPGVSLSEARKKTIWGGYTWDDDKIDFTKGVFFLVAGFGWNGTESSAVHPMTEDQAKRWFERYHGDDVDAYRRVFGAPATCFPEYREERRREDELERLRKELAEANLAKEAAEGKLAEASGLLSGVSGRPQAQAPDTTGPEDF